MADGVVKNRESTVRRRISLLLLFFFFLHHACGSFGQTTLLNIA